MNTHPTVLACAAALVLASVSISASAAAQPTELYSPFDRSDDIYVGMASMPTNPGLVRAMACFDGSGTNDAIWIPLGGPSGLTNDYVIHTEKSGSSASYFNRVLFAQYATYQAPGDCASASGSWSPLLYNGYYIDAEGAGGIDYLTAGAGDTILFGGAGDDFLLGEYSTNGLAYGGGGLDAIIGTRVSGSMLLGEADADCLEDRYPTINPFSVADCGAGTDYYGNSTNAGMTSCEQPRGECASY